MGCRQCGCRGCKFGLGPITLALQLARTVELDLALFDERISFIDRDLVIGRIDIQ